MIRSRWRTLRPSGQGRQILIAGQQDGPWRNQGENNGERVGVGRRLGGHGYPAVPTIYANGNYGFVYHLPLMRARQGTRVVVVCCACERVAIPVTTSFAWRALVPAGASMTVSNGTGIRFSATWQ